MTFFVLVILALAVSAVASIAIGRVLRGPAPDPRQARRRSTDRIEHQQSRKP